MTSAVIRNRTSAAYESKSVDCSESVTLGRVLKNVDYAPRLARKPHVVVPDLPGNGLVSDCDSTIQSAVKLVYLGCKNYIGGGRVTMWLGRSQILANVVPSRYYLADASLFRGLG